MIRNIIFYYLYYHYYYYYYYYDSAESIATIFISVTSNKNFSIKLLIPFLQ